MITVESITNRLQNLLNANTLGVNFNIYVDTGKYKKAIRRRNDVNEIINGISTVSSSDVSNTNDGLKVATMTIRTELLVKLKDTEDGRYQQSINFNRNQPRVETEVIEEGNNSYVQSIRSFLDNFCANNEFYSQEVEENGKVSTFSVSVAYSLIASGIRQMASPIGDCYSFVLYGYYYIIESGVNSRQYLAYLDGERIPYSTMTIRRVPSQEVAVYSGEKTATVKAINSNTVLGVSLVVPAFIDKFSSTIKNYFLRGENNVAHILTLKLDGERQDYLVLFGECDTTASGVVNVGQTISFVEALEKHGIISPFKNLYLYQASVDGKLNSVDYGINLTTSFIALYSGVTTPINKETTLAPFYEVFTTEYMPRFPDLRTLVDRLKIRLSLPNNYAPQDKSMQFVLYKKNDNGAFVPYYSSAIYTNGGVGSGYSISYGFANQEQTTIIVQSPFNVLKINNDYFGDLPKGEYEYFYEYVPTWGENTNNSEARDVVKGYFKVVSIEEYTNILSNETSIIDVTKKEFTPISFNANDIIYSTKPITNNNLTEI